MAKKIFRDGVPVPKSTTAKVTGEEFALIQNLALRRENLALVGQGIERDQADLQRRLQVTYGPAGEKVDVDGDTGVVTITPKKDAPA